MVSVFNFEISATQSLSQHKGQASQGGGGARSCRTYPSPDDAELKDDRRQVVTCWYGLSLAEGRAPEGDCQSATEIIAILSAESLQNIANQNLNHMSIISTVKSNPLFMRKTAPSLMSQTATYDI